MNLKQLLYRDGNKIMNRSNQGSLLISIIITMVILAALGAGIASMLTTGVRSSTDHSLSIQAFYLAESGFEWATHQLQKSYESNGEWEQACQNLDQMNTTQFLKGVGYYKVINSTALSAEQCKVSTLGWVGPQDEEKKLASRLLTGILSEEAITQSLSSEKNIFSSEYKWTGVDAHVSFENGSVTFSKKNEKDQLNRSKAVPPLIPEDSFNADDTIYLALELSESNLEKLSAFGLEQLPPDNQDIYWPERESEPFGSYNAVLYLGSGYTPKEINEQPNLKFIIEWMEDSISISSGCIGTKESCSIDLHNPINPPTWQEGK